MAVLAGSAKPDLARQSRTAPVRGQRPLPRPSPRAVLLVVGLAALTIRLALVYRAPAFVIADSDNYFFPGYQLARGLGFDLDLRRTPGYPLFIALVVARVGEDLSALLLAQHLLGVGTCLLVAWLGLRLFGAWTALLAGLGAAFAAPLLVAEHYMMAEALFIPLVALTLVVLFIALETARPWPLLLGGVMLGLTTLVRPIGLVAAVALGLALLVRERHLPRAIRRGLPALTGLLLVLVPWMARNALVHDSFTPEGNPGQTLVGRAMRHDSGFAFENPDDPDPARQRAREIMREGRGRFVSPTRERIKRELGLTDAEANRLMRDLSLEAILRQPGYYLAGTLGSFAVLLQGIPERPRDHWATRREERNREEWESHPEIRHLLGPPTPAQEAQFGVVTTLLSLHQPSRLGPILPLLALAGLAALCRNGRAATATLLGLTLVGLLLAGAALVAPLPRYRYPAEPLVALLAAGGLATLFTWARTRLGRLPRRRAEHPAYLR